MSSDAGPTPEIGVVRDYAGPTLEEGLLEHQTVTARLGDQDLGRGRVALDLLAQAIDLGVQRMGRDSSVVAPDLAQQRVAVDDPGARPAEIFQDRGFLLGQPNSSARGLLDQELGARPEGVGPMGKTASSPWACWRN
jgi:hypothetical protein